MDLQRNEKILIIEDYTNKAIDAMNNNWDIDTFIKFCDSALHLCSPEFDFGYYQVIATIFKNLSFRTRTAFSTLKLKKIYIKMYGYLSEKFSNMISLNINPDSEEEALLANDICCDVFDRACYFSDVFLDAGRNGGMVFGVVGILIGGAVSGGGFKESIKRIAQTCITVLNKFNTDNEQIRENKSAIIKRAKLK